MSQKREIALGVTGSIAAYKSLELARRLKEDKDITLSVIMTKEAQEFIRPLSFQALSVSKVYKDIFTQPDNWEIEHISLAERVSLILICPATANIIAKLACGICDDLLTCVVCATKAPILIAPAMNDNMFNHKIVQENIKRLKSLGYKFIGPRKGRLASGKEAIGCLENIDVIVREARRLAK